MPFLRYIYELHCMNYIKVPFCFCLFFVDVEFFWIITSIHLRRTFSTTILHSNDKISLFKHFTSTSYANSKLTILMILNYFHIVS